MLSLVGLKLCLCGQHIGGFISKITGCWPKTHCLEGLMIKGGSYKGEGGRWSRYQMKPAWVKRKERKKSHIKEMMFLWGYRSIKMLNNSRRGTGMSSLAMLLFVKASCHKKGLFVCLFVWLAFLVWWNISFKKNLQTRKWTILFSSLEIWGHVIFLA